MNISFDFHPEWYGIELDVVVEGTYTPATPDVMYLPNGDPGYPGDPAELEIDEVRIERFGGILVKPPILLDKKALGDFWEENYSKLLDAAQTQMESEGPDECD